MHYLTRILLAIWLIASTATAAPTHGAQQFEDGERVCFVGDSITHGGTYHSNIYLYYLTRFPEREIRIFNAGISGDTAERTLARFDADIAAHQPTTSTIMLGMNDVGRWQYKVGQSALDDGPDKMRSLNRYFQNMDTLAARLTEIGSDIIWITPSIYDQTAELKQTNNLGVNDALGLCADYVKNTARANKQGLVDFYSTMLAINSDIQSSDKSATIIGGDRVHPRSDPGHFIMAYQFLKAQDVPQYVSKIAINSQRGTEAESINCSITDIKSQPGELSFTALEHALPFPQTESIRQGLALVPFEEEMNQQILIVDNLAAGNYSLEIDTITIGSYTAEQLAKGINLATSVKAPQYQQALKVMKLNQQRNKIVATLREFAYTQYNAMAGYTGDRNDATAIEAHLSDQLKKKEGQSHYDYYKRKYESYCGLLPKVDGMKAELEALHQQLYQANQPVPHHFTLKKNVSR
ncbi:SGNH/GDSL hydrolase family protein [Coraliomargarita sp. W4R72]